MVMRIMVQTAFFLVGMGIGAVICLIYNAYVERNRKD
jgi:hypothetical protein